MSRREKTPIRSVLSTQGLAQRGDSAVAAVERVLRRAAGSAAPRDAARADLAAPLPAASAFPEGRLSPRLLVLLARALDTRAGTRVELQGEPLAALAATLTELKAELRPAQITLRTTSPERANLTLDRTVDPSRRDRVRVCPHDEATEERQADRLLAWTGDPALAGPKVDDGIVLRVDHTRARPTFVQETHLAGRVARIDLGGLDPARFRSGTIEPGKKAGYADTVPLRRLLLVERMQQNAWQGRATTRVEAGVALAVKRLFADAPAPPAGTPRHALARLLLHLGYLEQVTATRSGAEAVYRASLDTCETAEGYTFLGWTLAQQGKLDEAVESCKRAIATDPTLGNPYNDLGAYRLSEGNREEAKAWFERATQAPRYMAPHYPYTNLARIHFEAGDLEAAREAAEEALAHMPGYQPAERLLRMIGDRRGGLNR